MRCVDAGVVHVDVSVRVADAGVAKVVAGGSKHDMETDRSCF